MTNFKRGLFVVGVFLSVSAVCVAAPESGGYLAGYENTTPQPSAFSWWSTAAYILSLLAVFVFVALMAYVAARIFGGRFGKEFAQNAGGRVLYSLPLGPKMSVCVVEIAGRYLLLGVTEQNVSLLTEIEDAEEIEQLMRQSLANGFEGAMFSRQFGSLADLMQKIPPFFRSGK